MTNRRREEVNIAGPQPGARPLGGVPQVAQVSAAPLARLGGGRGDVRPERLEPTAEPQVWETARQGLAVVSHELGQIADKSAIDEGRRAGALSGLDPEFRLKGDLTLYAQAFDRAGLESAKSRIAVDLAAKMEAAGDKHQADPAKLDTELGAIRQGFMSALDRSLAPDVLPMLETDFNRRRVGLVRAATREMHSRAAAEMRGQLQDHVTILSRTAEQQAYRLGLDGEADAILAGEVQALTGRLAQKGPDGKPLVDPAQARKLVRETEADMVRARIFGTFARLETPAEKAKFVEEIETRYLSGADKLLNTLDPRQYEVIKGHLRSEASKIDAATRIAQKGLEHDVRQIQKDAADGIPPSPQFFTTVKSKLAQHGTPEQIEALNDALAEVGFVQQLNATGSPRQVEAWVDAERARLTKAGGSADGNETARLRVAEKWLASAHKQLAVDPLGFAQKIGIPVPDIDVSSGDRLAETLPARLAAAKVAGERFERDWVAFKPQDKAALSHAARQGGAGLIRVATAIVKGAGDEAPRVLRELVKDAPEAAMIGQMMVDGANPATIDDAAKTIELRAKAEYEPTYRPKPSEQMPRLGAVLGSALAARPDVEAQVRQTAEAAYEARARKNGWSVFKPDEYDTALREVLGEISDRGTTYGGLGWTGGWRMFGGRQIVVPPGVRQSGFDELVGTLRDEDLDVAGRPKDTTGKPLGVKEVKAGTFVWLGGSRYAVALGDPSGPDPQYLKGNGGPRGTYAIDIEPLRQRLKSRRPDLFLGAGR